MADSRHLPDWIDGFMKLSDNSEPPMLYRKWCAISSIASALQRKVYIKLSISLTVYPNFYIVLVGPPSAGKGTAMAYAYDIVSQVTNIRLSAQATTLQALIRRMKDINLTDMDLITGRQQFHSSMTIFSEEFTVFLGYKNIELISALCNWYDCVERWVYDTIKHNEIEVVGVWVNILGGTTHENIQLSFPVEAVGTGLSSRIIFVNEYKRDKLVIFPTVTEEELKLQQCLIEDLEQISMMVGQFAFTKKFTELYSDWCKDAYINPPFSDPKFDGYNGRRRRHLLALSMVCSASESNEMIIKADHLARAIHLLAEVEMKMGTVFRGIGKSDISSLINDAIIFIENSTTPDIPLWQFARHFEGNMDKFIMDRVLVTLEAAEYIQIVKQPGAGSVIHVLGKKR